MEGEYLAKLFLNSGYNCFPGVPTFNLNGFLGELDRQGFYQQTPTASSAAAFALGASVAGRKCCVPIFNYSILEAMSSFAVANRVYKQPFCAIVDAGQPDHLVQYEWIKKEIGPLAKTMNAKVIEISGTSPEILKASDFVHGESQSVIYVLTKKLRSMVSEICRPKEVCQEKRSEQKECIAGLRKKEVLRAISEGKGSSLIVSERVSSGRILSEIDESPRLLYYSGKLGDEADFGCGLAAHQKENVIVIQGDGAITLGMNGLATIGHHNPKNLLHVLIDNKLYHRTGGQPALGPNKDWCSLAIAMGYLNVKSAGSISDIRKILAEWKENPTCTFLHVSVSPQAEDLEAETIKIGPLNNFKQFVKQVSGE